MEESWPSWIRPRRRARSFVCAPGQRGELAGCAARSMRRFRRWVSRRGWSGDGGRAAATSIPASCVSVQGEEDTYPRSDHLLKWNRAAARPERRQRRTCANCWRGSDEHERCRRSWAGTSSVIRRGKFSSVDGGTRRHEAMVFTAGIGEHSPDVRRANLMRSLSTSSGGGWRDAARQLGGGRPSFSKDGSGARVRVSFHQ